MGAGDIKSQDDYVSKTAKLIPAEALALYLTMSGQIKAFGIDEDVQRNMTLGIAVIVCAVIVPFVLYKLQHVRSYAHYAISMSAFAIWVFNAQYDRLPTENLPYDTINVAIGSIVLLIFTFMAPFLLPREK